MSHDFQSERSTSEIGVNLLVFFTFFITFFYQKTNQGHNLLPDCACGTFCYVCCENCLSDFPAFVLKLSKSGNILFRSANRNCLPCSASIVIALARR